MRESRFNFNRFGSRSRYQLPPVGIDLERLPNLANVHRLAGLLFLSDVPKIASVWVEVLAFIRVWYKWQTKMLGISFFVITLAYVGTCKDP